MAGIGIAERQTFSIDNLTLLLIISTITRRGRGKVGIERRSREQVGCAERPARNINVEWSSEPQGESLVVANPIVGWSEQVANAGFASVIMAESLSDQSTKRLGD